MNPLKFIQTLNETEPEMARREYITRNVLFFSFIVDFFFTLISFILYLSGKMPLDTLIIYSIILIMLFVSMFLTEKGYLRAVGIIPLLFMYFAAVNGNYIGGIDAPGNFLYVLLIMFVAIIYGYRKMWIALGICLVTYLCLAWLISSGHIIPYRTAETVFVNRVVITSGSLLVIALMIWLLGRSYQSELDERIKIEKALRNTEESYRAIFENTGTSMILIEEDMTISMVNAEFVRNTGYSIDEINGHMKWTELVHPDEIGRMIEQHRLRREISGGALPGYELRYITKTGALRDALLNIQLVPGTKKSVASLVDITDRKRVEDALLKSEEKFRLITENMVDCVALVDINGIYQYVTPSYRNILGYDPEDMIGIKALSLTHPDDLERITRIYLEGIEQGWREKYFETRTRHKDGHYVNMELRASLLNDSQGKVIGAVWSARDITKRLQLEQERKRAEEALGESEKRFRSMIQSLSDIIFIVDRNGQLTYESPSATRILGYQPGYFIGKSPFTHVHPDDLDQVVKDMDEVFRSVNPGIPTEFRYRKLDGTWIYLEAIGSNQFENHGIQGIVLTVRDITARKQAEKQLQDTLESLRNAVGTTIQVMVSAIETRDPYTAGHQVRSANLARTIATEMGLSQRMIEGISMAGSIHDIGKLSIPSEILTKPTKLLEIEFSLIKEHARQGYEILKNVESPWPLAEIVYQHHERMDGSGYPRNLKGEEIIMEARILAVADVVEAMASHRPYRPALGIDAALEEIEKNRGTFYDEAVADTCLRLFREKGFQLEKI